MDYEKLMEAIKFFGLKDRVSIRSLKRIYRSMSKDIHPDVGGSEDSMKKLNEYYKTLLEYLERYEIPIDEDAIIRSLPSAFVYFQYHKKNEKDGRVGF